MIYMNFRLFSADGGLNNVRSLCSLAFRSQEPRKRSMKLLNNPRARLWNISSCCCRMTSAFMIPQSERERSTAGFKDYEDKVCR